MQSLLEQNILPGFCLRFCYQSFKDKSCALANPRAKFRSSPPTDQLKRKVIVNRGNGGLFAMGHWEKEQIRMSSDHKTIFSVLRWGEGIDGGQEACTSKPSQARWSMAHFCPSLSQLRSSLKGGLVGYQNCVNYFPRRQVPPLTGSRLHTLSLSEYGVPRKLLIL